MSRSRFSARLLGACLAGSLFCCGYVFGQQAPEPNPTRYKLGSADIAMKIAYLGGNTDGKAEQALHEVLLDAGRKADVAAIVTDYSVYKLSEARSKAKGAVQVSEAADVEALRLRIVEVHQNARIIELLEQIAKK